MEASFLAALFLHGSATTETIASTWRLSKRRDEILAMEGTGWEGDLDDLRGADDPEPLP